MSTFEKNVTFSNVGTWWALGVVWGGRLAWGGCWGVFTDHTHGGCAHTPHTALTFGGPDVPGVGWI